MSIQETKQQNTNKFEAVFAKLETVKIHKLTEFKLINYVQVEKTMNMIEAIGFDQEPSYRTFMRG